MKLPLQDNLTSLKDDMTAFVEGHGMRRFPAYVNEEVPSVTWEGGDNPDSWKDFVELAKAAGASFVTMNDVELKKADVEFLVDRLTNANFPSEEDIEEARWLRAYIGKTGFLQLGFPMSGVMFLHEVSTEWYERYQRLVDIAEETGGFIIDEADQDDEV